MYRTVKSFMDTGGVSGRKWSGWPHADCTPQVIKAVRSRINQNPVQIKKNHGLGNITPKTFNNHHYLQAKATAMETRMTSSYANLSAFASLDYPLPLHQPKWLLTLTLSSLTHHAILHSLYILKHTLRESRTFSCSNPLPELLPIPIAPPSYLITCTQCDVFYVKEIKNSLSSKMNGHWSSTKSPNNLHYPVVIHTNSLLIPVGMYMNYITYPPDMNQITCCHLELVYQFILSSRYSPDINLR